MQRGEVQRGRGAEAADHDGAADGGSGQSRRNRVDRQGAWVGSKVEPDRQTTVRWVGSVDALRVAADQFGQKRRVVVGSGRWQRQVFGGAVRGARQRVDGSRCRLHVAHERQHLVVQTPATPVTTRPRRIGDHPVQDSGGPVHPGDRGDRRLQRIQTDSGGGVEDAHLVVVRGVHGAGVFRGVLRGDPGMRMLGVVRTGENTDPARGSVLARAAARSISTRRVGPLGPSRQRTRRALPLHGHHDQGKLGQHLGPHPCAVGPPHPHLPNV